MKDETKGTILDALLVMAVICFILFLVGALGLAVASALSIPITAASGLLIIGVFITSIACGAIHLKYW